MFTISMINLPIQSIGR